MSPSPEESFFGSDTTETPSGQPKKGEKKPRLPFLQNLREKLTTQLKKAALKLKEYAQAPGKFLKTLARIDPGVLALALGPALAVAGVVTYAVANEREDGRQVEQFELTAIEERMTAAEEFLAIPTIRPALKAELDVAVDDLLELQAGFDELASAEPGEPAATQAELAEVRKMIEEFDPADPADIVALAERLDGLRIADPDELSELQAEVEALDIVGAAELAELEAAVGALEFVEPAQLAAVEAQIAALPPSADPAAVAELQARVDALASSGGGGGEVVDLSAIEAQIADLEANAVDPALITQLQDSVLALEQMEFPEPFDPTAILTAISDTQAALDEVEAVFFADLERQWDVGVPVTLNINNGCSGQATIFQRPGGSFVGSNRTPGTTESFCVRFVPVPPTIPAACSLPSSGSLRFYWERGQGSVSASFGATSGDTTTLRDSVASTSGGSSGSMFLTLRASDGPDASKTAVAGDALQFVSRDLTAWDNFYEVNATVVYGAGGTGVSPSVAAGLDSLSARVEGTLTCVP